MIDTVFLDAGGVLCHPSWTRVAAALVGHGAPVTTAALAAAEQQATHELDQAAVIGATDDRSRGCFTWRSSRRAPNPNAPCTLAISITST